MTQLAWGFWRQLFARFRPAKETRPVGTDAQGRTLVQTPCCKRTVPLAHWFNHDCALSPVRSEPVKRWQATTPGGPGARALAWLGRR